MCQKAIEAGFLHSLMMTLYLQENPAVILENLRALKAKHTTLSYQVMEMATAQKDLIDSIRINLNSIMDLIQQFQQTTDVEVA